MCLESWSAIIVALISLIGNIFQYKSAKAMGKENKDLRAKLRNTTQTHSGSGDNIAAGRDMDIRK